MGEGDEKPGPGPPVFPQLFHGCACHQLPHVTHYSGVCSRFKTHELPVPAPGSQVGGGFASQGTFGSNWGHFWLSQLGSATGI